MRSTLILVCLLNVLASTAQRQYWGVLPPNDIPAAPAEFGGIYRFDSTAMSPELIVPFDTLGTLGSMRPGSKLLLASNGGLYGLSYFASHVIKLFWIDPVTDSLHIAVNFSPPQLTLQGAWTNLMETSTGLIVGSTGGWMSPSTLFKFDPTSGVITQIGTLPFTFFGGFWYARTLQGTPFEASDGYIYTIT
ncbi:MAG: hypothetical protein LH647_00150, partial [Leptolyngbyaceae cyanobacterium CAN_BIN12]|nr:hypothetical protein [Leptolyngbyaceae cyanobacterium CAN_BIN12]